MRAITAFALAIAALSLTRADSAALAQDVAPETPPELRDFRLDRQPGQPEAQPTVEPVPVTPPPAASTVPGVERSTPRSQAPAPAPRRTSASAAAPEQNEAPTGGPTGVPSVTTAEPVAIEELAPQKSEPQPEPSSSLSSQNWWLIAAALGMVGAILIIVFLFRRSRNRPLEYEPIDQSAAVAEPPKASVPVKLAPKSSPPTQPISTLKPRIVLDFIPEKASISFTALTVKGELRIINQSDLPAKNMQLRAALISASAQQETEISGFHNAAIDTKAQNLGDAKAGERIATLIELTVPLSDLQSFPLGDQQLFVPILVGNIAYSDESGILSETAEIACMIGREANPPKPKMAPLRLDLGPRSFSPLGQRPLLI